MDLTIQGVNGHVKPQSKDNASIHSKNNTDNLLLPDIGKHIYLSNYLPIYLSI